MDVRTIAPEAGHGGKSGRFERFRHNAEWQAFMLARRGGVTPAPS